MLRRQWIVLGIVALMTLHAIVADARILAPMGSFTKFSSINACMYYKKEHSNEASET